MSEQEYKEEYIRRIHKVQDYIELHIGQPLSIEELSDAAGFSKYHFSRIFQSMLHEPLAHYVNRIRMENSLFLLAHRLDKNMTDIAYELGFTDSAVFSRAFKNCFGVSPREYRKEYSKNCKDSFLLSDYNKDTAKKKWEKKEREGKERESKEREGKEREGKEWENKELCVTGQVTKTCLEEKQVAYVRHTGTYETLAKEYPKLIQRLFACVKKQGLLVEDYWVLAIYHDNPEFTKESQFRTSLCVTVPINLRIQEDETLGVMKLEGGLYAVGHFKMLQEQYSDAWNYMYQEWLTCSGYAPRNSYPFEVYCNIPQDDENPIHEVDIYVPIEPIHF
jgi:AraC family transcriptional regulator